MAGTPSQHVMTESLVISTKKAEMATIETTSATTSHSLVSSTKMFSRTRARTPMKPRITNSRTSGVMMRRRGTNSAARLKKFVHMDSQLRRQKMTKPLKTKLKTVTSMKWSLFLIKRRLNLNTVKVQEMLKSRNKPPSECTTSNLSQNQTHKILNPMRSSHNKTPWNSLCKSLLKSRSTKK